MQLSRIQRNGITLVETLVVIGIIGLILGIAIPSVLTARGLARNSECQNQVRQILLDRLEGLNTPEIDLISVCPIDPQADLRRENGYLGYVFPLSNAPNPKSNDEFLKFLKRATNKSKHLILLEAAEDFFDGEAIFSDLYVVESRVYRPIPTKHRFYETFALKRHLGGSSNVGFADGHVEQISSTVFEKAIANGEWCFRREADGSFKERF